MRRFRIVITATVLFSLLAASQAHAAIYWTGTTGSWHDPANWDNGIPTSFDDALIDNGGTAQITTDAVSDSLYLGYNDFGAIEQTGGANTIIGESHYGGGLYFGYHSGSSGAYNLSGGQLSAGGEYIGRSGTGEFNQSGGTNTVHSGLYVGWWSGSSGIYNLSAGDLSTGYESIGRDGTGEFNQTGGNNTIDGWLYLGYESGSSGTYNLSEGQLSAEGEYIGRNGTGEFTQSSGINTVGYLFVNESSCYTLSGGTLSISDSAEINGQFHFIDSDWTLNVGGGLANFENSTIDGAGSASFSSVADTLTISPTGFDPAGGFGSYNALGLVHNAGNTLVVSAGEGFSGRGWIGDPVVNRGSIVASGGSLQFKGGLTICEGGTLDSSGYGFTVDNGQTVTITASGGQLSASSEYIGRNGAGEFNQSGGTNTVSNKLCLGLVFGSSGTYNLSGTGQLSADVEYIGYSGAGEFNQSGGTNTVDYYLCLGDYFGSSGTYNLNAGILVSENQYVGGFYASIGADRRGTGVFNQVGGTNMVGDSLYFGLVFGSSGTYNLSGTGQLSADREYIGYRGTGEFIQSGGSNTVGNYLYLGRGSGSSGTYNLSGAGVLSAQYEYIGYTGTGEFNQSGGTNTVDYPLYLGFNSGSSGTYNLSGGELSATTETIGRYGTGEFNQSGGTNTVIDYLYLGHSPSSSGTYNLSGGELSVGSEYLGYYYGTGTGEFNQSGGTNTVGYLFMKDGSSYTLSGGTLSIGDSAEINGSFHLADGDACVEISGSFTLQDNAVFMAVPGTTIHMTGSNFENTSTSLGNLAGLENTTFVFEDSGDTDTFEIAGYDYSLIEENFYGNFGLEGLILDASYTGYLQLVDANVNFIGLGPSTQPEALYVRTLVLGGNATLDLNGYNLYAMEYTNYGGTVLNGEIQAMSETVIPEPGTLLLLAPALLGIAGVLRRRIGNH